MTDTFVHDPECSSLHRHPDPGPEGAGHFDERGWYYPPCDCQPKPWFAGLKLDLYEMAEHPTDYGQEEHGETHADALNALVALCEVVVAAQAVVNAPYPSGAHAAGAEPEIAHLRGVLGKASALGAR